MNLTSFELVPLKGISGEINLGFGAIRSEILERIPLKPWTKPSANADFGPFDQYFELGIQLHYDGNNQLEFIETYSPCKVYFDGIDLTDLEYEKTIKNLEAKGFSKEEDEEGLGFRFPALGVGFYVDEKLMTTNFFSKDYYADL